MPRVIDRNKFLEIKSRLEMGSRREEIAKDLGVSHTIVSRVKGVKSYRSYLEKYAPSMVTTKPASKPVVEEQPKKKGFFARFFGKK